MEGARIESGPNGAVRIPLGTLYAGQHREALEGIRKAGFVRARIDGEVLEVNPVPVP